MGNRKKTKPHTFLRYISDTFRQRLGELGITRYRFVNDNLDITSYPAVYKLWNGKVGTTTTTLYDIMDRLGMEIVIRPKQHMEEECLTVEQTAHLYEVGFDTQGILHPTAGDLIRWLPKHTGFEQDFFVSYDAVENEWVAGYQNTDNCFSSDSLVDALYQLLLWVIEEKKRGC